MMTQEGKSVEATGEIFELEFDTAIGATGAQVDRSAFEENSVNLDDWGGVKTLPSMESSVENVYVIGDCRQGASNNGSGHGGCQGRSPRHPQEGRPRRRL